MPRRSTPALLLAALLAAVVVTAAAVPSALAAPKGKPGVTPPGVPPGQPFQTLQKEIDGLTTQVQALQATAPQPGLMWINPLELTLGFSSTSTAVLDLVGSGTQQGLVVSSTGLTADVLQTGLQVPLGFAITGVRVCYASGATGSFVNAAQLVEFTVPPTLPGATPLNDVLSSPGNATITCVDTTSAVSVDPSAGGPVYLSLGLTFTANEALVIRGVGLHLSPVSHP